MKNLGCWHLSSNLVRICIIVGILLTACDINKDWDEYYNSDIGVIENNVLELIKENNDYMRFYEKVVAAGYDSLLTKDQYFTVFVPVNSAFEGLPDYTDEEWRKIIGFHISYFNLYSRDFGDLDMVTIIGKYLEIRKTDGDNVMIFDSRVNPDQVDINCQNGIIHEIDKLLIPKKNIYEHIMALDDNYSLIKNYINSKEISYIDLEKSTRIGVDDNGNTIYDTVWATDNYYLDNIVMINNETMEYTALIASDQEVLNAINNASEYFGDISDLNENDFYQLLSIVFSASFYSDIYRSGELPDTMVSVEGKTVNSDNLVLSGNVDTKLSNGIIHELDALDIPKEFFLFPINIECDEKSRRRLSNTVYATEIRSDSRATRGSYFYYESKFVGDYVEYSVDMVLATKYWFFWTGPALGGSYYQLSVDGVNIGDSVECYFKGNFKPVESGSYTFDHFGTRTVRMTIVNEQTLPGYNAIYLDYIRLIPDELYRK